MRIRGRWLPRLLPALVGVAALGGCGGDAETGSTSGTHKPPKPSAVVQIVVDANRNGQLDYDDPTELDNKNGWTAEHGASFLANLDDDDGDGKRDVEDDVINGDDDRADFAEIGI